jgi:hypothetical protein
MTTLLIVIGALVLFYLLIRLGVALALWWAKRR